MNLFVHGKYASRNFSIRAHARCPACQKEMPIGRLQQHSKVHK